MSSPPDDRPRFVPDALLPPYAFVPGRGLPHPVRDPEGHLFGATPAVERIDPARWRECRAYLWGVDLCNRGYYWEAHEAWEGVWRGHDRSETPALFLQGLIKLAAAGVKVREGVSLGVASLAGGAASHFREVRGRRDGGESYGGLKVAELESVADRLGQDPGGLSADTDAGPRVVIGFVLRPDGVGP
jgi:predicted metal-dependent hydrolase